VAQQQAQSGSGEGENAQEFPEGSQRESRTAQGDKGRVGGTPLAACWGPFMAAGIVNLVLSYQRFHMLVGIACCLSAGSFFIPVWKRTSARAVDGIRGPAALLLAVWAIGLYGYATGPATGGVYNRLTAGFIGSVYVVVFAFEALSEPRLLEIDHTGGDHWSSGR
jgi:hypothetical protein